MIWVGRMAKEWGKFPHEVIEDATTYDMMIYDVLATYDKYEADKQAGKIDPDVYGLKEEELLEIWKKNNGK